MTEQPKTPEIPESLLEELLKDYRNPEDLLGPDGLMKELKKRLIEKALGAELTAHLGYDKADPAGRGSGNSRNGASRKTVKSEDGAVEIAVPQDRAGERTLALLNRNRRLAKDFEQSIAAAPLGSLSPQSGSSPVESRGYEIAQDNFESDSEVNPVRGAHAENR